MNPPCEGSCPLMTVRCVLIFHPFSTRGIRYDHPHGHLFFFLSSLKSSSEKSPLMFGAHSKAYSFDFFPSMWKFVPDGIAACIPLVNGCSLPSTVMRASPSCTK